VPTGAVALDGGRVAIGTFKAGIVVATVDGRVLDRIAAREDLGSNNVYALWADRSELWAALGNGVARLDGAGWAEKFDRDSGLGDGTPLKVIGRGGRDYILTTEGVFRLDGPQDGRSLHPLLDAEGLLRDEAAVGENLWVGGFSGAWRLDPGSRAMTRDYAVAADIFRVMPAPRDPQGVLVLENYTAKILTPSPHGGLAARDLGVRLDGAPLSMVEMENKNPPAGPETTEIGISTLAGSIYRLAWRDSGDSVRLTPVAFYHPGSGLPAGAARPRLVPLGRRMFAFTETDILLLRDDGRAFEPVPELAGYVGIAGTTRQPSSGPEYWIVQSKALAGVGSFGVLRVETTENGGISTGLVDVPGLDSLGDLTAIDGTAGGDGAALWVSGVRGILRVRPEGLQNAAPPPEARIQAVLANEALLDPKNGRAALESGVRRLSFRFPSAAGAADEPVFYQTRLDGVDGMWSPPTKAATRNLDGLAPGNYGFHVRLVDRFGRPGPETSFAFDLPAPWYLTWPALAGYAGLAALAVAAGVRGRLRHLQRQNEKLNRLVADRTRELELSNTAKSEFLENISHELRNPLNGLLGMVTMLHEERLEPADREILRTLRGCSEQMARSFEDVLGFSKLEYGYVNMERKPFELSQALDEVIALHSAAARQAGCELKLGGTTSVSSGLVESDDTEVIPRVFVGDVGKIKTIVSNFVSNAIKYAPGKPVEIRVEVDPVSGETDGTEPAGPAGIMNLLIEVTDRGPGIPTDEHELIFKKFVRGSDAKNRQVPGSGLGLASCEALARLMNGSVGVESAPGQGATFHLSVLVTRVDGRMAAPSAERDIPPRASVSGSTSGNHRTPDETLARSATRTGPTALIVEDEVYNQAVLQGIALKLGFAPDVVGSAEDAAARLAEKAYDVVFLDWELPDGKGEDVARAIRNGGRTSPIILAITAHDSDEIRERCRAAGMNGFLLKPYNEEKVRRALAEAGVGRKNGDENGKSESALGSELDLEALAHYSRARPQDGGAALHLYSQAIGTEAAALRKALGSGDDGKIASCSHRLRSLACLVNAQDLDRTAHDLEQLARKGGPADRSAPGKMALDACAELLGKLG